MFAGVVVGLRPPTATLTGLLEPLHSSAGAWVVKAYWQQKIAKSPPTVTRLGLGRMGFPVITRVAISALVALLLTSAIRIPAQTGRRRVREAPKSGVGGSTSVQAPPSRRTWEENHSWYEFTAAVIGGDSSVRDSLVQLLDSGVTPNDKDKYGNSALHAAAIGGDAGVVRYLLTRGADINGRDKLGRTPLMISASLGGTSLFGHSDMPVWAMLWTEPMCDSEGSPTVLRFARQALDWYETAKRHRETVRLLLAASADVTEVDREGRGTLDYAARSGLTDFDDLIRRSGKVTGQPACALRLVESPALRGFRLGMTLREALAHFKSFSLPDKNSCGRVSLDIGGWGEPVASLAKSPGEFDGVIGLRLSFLDDRLAYVRVTYERDAGGRTPSEFRAVTASKLSLPGVWRPLFVSDMEHTHVIGCDGFKVMAGYRDGPYAELYDTAAVQTLLGRRAAEEDRRRREDENERERRRKSYKP